MVRITVEEGLRQIQTKAAVLRYLASSAAGSVEHPDQTVLDGIGEVCGEIEDMAQATRRALSPDALCTELRHSTR